MKPDTDGDTFGDGVEVYVTTDALDACPDNSGDDCWPPDINMDRVVDVIDAVAFLGDFPSACMNP